MLHAVMEDLLAPGQLMDGGIAVLGGVPDEGADVHESLEIGVVLDGEQERRSEGVAVTVGAGDVWLIPGWEVHGWGRTSPEWRAVHVFFLPEFLGEETFDGLPWLNLFTVSPRQRPRVTTATMRQQALGIGEQLARELERRDMAWMSAVRLAVLQLLLMLRRAWEARVESAAPQWGASALSRVEPALRLVYEERDRRVSLGEAAAKCALSVTQFRFLFRRGLGLTFGKFALRVRLAHAAHLLAHTDLSLDRISEQTGFANRAHLSRRFARMFGHTPKQYRTTVSAAVSER
jgi:AraC-like DNA-binding protein